jgi:hypothetical protein
LSLGIVEEWSPYSDDAVRHHEQGVEGDCCPFVDSELALDLSRQSVDEPKVPTSDAGDSGEYARIQRLANGSFADAREARKWVLTTGLTSH